ncbi:MAG: phosphatidylglycerol lysyltransferase domain-containing protein [Peptostreptococcaceae bacterium]|nr:phosphatidylglycerol lysyltransferase domain-containing protein [Peptostreptococcaceae bacterium]
MITISVSTKLLKKIDLKSYNELQPEFKQLKYEACEYSFTTMFMWQHTYNTRYYKTKEFIVIIGNYENDEFSVLPLAKKENMNKAFNFIQQYFIDNDKKLNIRAANEEFVEFLNLNYPNKYNIIEERDYFDYVYKGEKLKSLKGRKLHRKRNHIKKFMKNYEDRYEYRKLTKEDLNACLNLLDMWKDSKEDDESVNDEIIAIKKVFDNIDDLDIKIAGVFIDQKLEAFTFGEYLNDDMALIHVEKANPSINGLYPFINQMFIKEEFGEVEYVNREEDLGIEGLRKAKLSYYPDKLVKKYTIKEI